MSAETKTERVLRDVLNSDNLRDFLGGDVVNNAMKWRFLQAALIVLDGHGLLGDPDAKKNATPAQLDPSKVKAGDMVRVLVVTIDSPVYEVSGEAYMLGHALAVGGHVLTGPGVTLTAHQPAPEPELEWKPGTLALLSLLNDDLVPRAYRTSIGTWHSIDDNRSWSDEDVNYVHEVVVINPADVDVDALAEALRVEWSGKDLDVTFSWSDIAKTVLTELGIEATS